MAKHYINDNVAKHYTGDTVNYLAPAFILVALGLGACSNQGSEKPGSRSVSKQTKDLSERVASPSHFQLRDFSRNIIRRDRITIIEDSAILICKSGPDCKGISKVFLSGRRSPGDSTFQTYAYMIDGVGTVQARMYETKESQGEQQVISSSWNVLGSLPLAPASIESDTSVQPPSDKGTAKTGNSARFAIRDFALRRGDVDGNELQVGSGTVIALDEEYKTGTYLLTLTAKPTHASEFPIEPFDIFIRDGVGTVRTYDYKDTKNVGYSDWRAFGVAAVTPAKLVEQNLADPQADKAASTSSEEILIQLRDFSINDSFASGVLYSEAPKGILVALDERLKKGRYLVFVESLWEGASPTYNTVIMRDGVASVQTQKLFSTTLESKPARKFKAWQIVGYSPLAPAELSVASQ